MKNYITYFLIFICGIFLTSCNTNSNTEDFDQFYAKFHNDSTFQMSRIRFPLEGKKSDGFDKQNWSEKNWDILKTKIFDVDTTEFKIEFKKTDTEFFQKCYIPNSGFKNEYRFELLNKKWYLVYALDANL